MRNERTNVTCKLIIVFVVIFILVNIFLFVGISIKNKKSFVGNENVHKVVLNTIQPTECVTSEPTLEPKKEIQYKTVIKEKLISKHSINNSSSYGNRNINMAVAASIINGETNGYILEKDAEFSWLNIVGNTTSEKGFKEAGVIINRTAQTGLGGGVCQVSSTINSAIVEAGIKTHAQKHSVKSRYITSNDCEATVSYDSNIDFYFKNTLDYPIRIKVIAKEGKVTVKVFKRIEKKVQKN